MNETIHQPYAKLFEFVMGIIPEAKKLLKEFGDQQLISALNLDTLKTAHGIFKSGHTGLENFITDMLFTCECNGQESYIHLLLEHKSYLENPKKQIILYLMLAYHQQELNWKRARQEAKQRGETVPKETFKPTPIIPIIFYHGKGKWKDYKFADRFDLPEKWMTAYIPYVKVFVIDMSDFPDEHIEKIGSSFLQPMLFMFKHKGDKEFLKQNTKKIFKFVQDLSPDKTTQKFLYTIFYFMIQTFNLVQEDIDEIIKTLLPITDKTNINMVQGEVVTVIDQAMLDGILIGKEEGREKGREEGREEGKQLTELKNKIETVLIFLKNFPILENSAIASLCKVKEKFVAEVRKTFKQDNEALIKTYTRSTFKTISNMTEKDFVEMEKIMLKLWEDFKKVEK